MKNALPLAASILTLGLLGAGCELTETCDPTLDPNCTSFEEGLSCGALEHNESTCLDSGTVQLCTDGLLSETACTESCSAGICTGGSGCGVLGEGQTRCVDGSTMEMCSGGGLSTTTCGGVCANTACEDAIQYVRIVDVTGEISGQHPGADIDAIALESDGQTFYGQRVSDFFITTDVSNLASDTAEILGQPDVGPNECDLSDGAEHWVSLAGGQIVVAFPRAIQSGDRITVYECAGAAQDAFDVTIGVSERLEGDWTTILEEAVGTVSAVVP
jgi:hypothetical protein